MIAAAILTLAAALVDEAWRSWRRDRAINGRTERSGVRRLVAFAALGRSIGPLAARIPTPPFDRHDLYKRSGWPLDLSDSVVSEARAGSMLAFGAVGTAGLLLMGSTGGLMLMLAGLAFGWLYPDLWLRSAAARRAERIESQAPLALDLIAATVAAGVALDNALAAAAQASSGPLRTEFERVGANLALGRRRGDELRDLAERTGSASLTRLAAALRVSDRLGVPLADGLRRQARRARAERALRVQERAASAAPRILLVVVLVLVPAALLPVLAALALTALGSSGQLGF
jgi:Flp pilus assembly protein TadB